MHVRSIAAGLRPYATSRALVAAGAALALGLSACGGSGGSSDNGGNSGKKVAFQLKVGDLVPLTGDLSVFGPPGRKAADLAVKQINAAAKQAGVDTTVSVSHADTETSAQASVQAARKLISGGATCLAGAWASADTIATAKSVSSRQRIPLISPASTSAEITTLSDNDYLFRTAPSDLLQAKALADTVEKELGGTDKTISLAARNDAYGEGLINAFKKAWEAKGGKTTGPVLYDPEQPSYNSEAGQIVAGNPDGYVIVDFPETYAKMGAALVRTGGFDAGTLFLTDGLASDTIPKGIPKAAAAGARGTRPGTPKSGAVVGQFAKLYKAAGGPGRQTFDAQNFDAVMLCYLAAVAADSTKGSDIQAKLQSVSAPGGKQYDFTQLSEAIKALSKGEDIDFQGVTGPVDFDDAGDPTTATYEVYKYGNDGKLSVLRQFQASGGGS